MVAQEVVIGRIAFRHEHLPLPAKSPAICISRQDDGAVVQVDERRT
jgi:hypothetical protein